MINRTMCLSGSNRSNLQVQAALTAVTDIIKDEAERSGCLIEPP